MECIVCCAWVQRHKAPFGARVGHIGRGANNNFVVFPTHLFFEICTTIKTNYRVQLRN
jgi:hypothetical protein